MTEEVSATCKVLLVRTTDGGIAPAREILIRRSANATADADDTVRFEKANTVAAALAVMMIVQRRNASHDPPLTLLPELAICSTGTSVVRSMVVWKIHTLKTSIEKFATLNAPPKYTIDVVVVVFCEKPAKRNVELMKTNRELRERVSVLLV